MSNFVAPGPLARLVNATTPAEREIAINGVAEMVLDTYAPNITREDALRLTRAGLASYDRHGSNLAKAMPAMMRAGLI